jgi:hypothetical protein
MLCPAGKSWWETSHYTLYCYSNGQRQKNAKYQAHLLAAARFMPLKLKNPPPPLPTFAAAASLSSSSSALESKRPYHINAENKKGNSRQ